MGGRGEGRDRPVLRPCAAGALQSPGSPSAGCRRLLPQPCVPQRGPGTRPSSASGPGSAWSSGLPRVPWAPTSCSRPAGLSRRAGSPRPAVREATPLGPPGAPQVPGKAEPDDFSFSSLVLPFFILFFLTKAIALCLTWVTCYELLPLEVGVQIQFSPWSTEHKAPERLIRVPAHEVPPWDLTGHPNPGSGWTPPRCGGRACFPIKGSRPCLAT